MKKLFVFFAVLLLAAGFVFAQEEAAVAAAPVAAAEPVAAVEVPPEPLKTEFFNMEVSIGFPIHLTNGLHKHELLGVSPAVDFEDKIITVNTSAGFAMNFNFSNRFGMNLDFDFFFAGKIGGTSAPTSSYNGMFGANIYLGPVIYFYNDGTLRIPWSFGGHLYYFTEDVWNPELDGSSTPGIWINYYEIQFGVATSLGVQLHFSKSVYMFSRTTVAIDLFRIHKSFDAGIDTLRHMDPGALSWMVKPVIGVGLKY